MKTWMFALAVAIAFCFTATTSAGDIPNDTLADMGLAGMQKMSDEQGMAVRGEFFYFTATGFVYVHKTKIPPVACNGKVSVSVSVVKVVSRYSFSN